MDDCSYFYIILLILKIQFVHKYLTMLFNRNSLDNSSSIFLIAIAFPSFQLLYLIDEVIDSIQLQLKLNAVTNWLLVLMSI